MFWLSTVHSSSADNKFGKRFKKCVRRSSSPIKSPLRNCDQYHDDTSMWLSNIVSPTRVKVFDSDRGWPHTRVAEKHVLVTNVGISSSEVVAFLEANPNVEQLTFLEVYPDYFRNQTFRTSSEKSCARVFRETAIELAADAYRAFPHMNF